MSIQGVRSLSNRAVVYIVDTITLAAPERAALTVMNRVAQEGVPTFLIAPISDEEAASMTASLAEGFKRTRSVANFSEGDSVKVIEGPFASFVGVVENISDKGKVKVQVSIFGRPTPVELEFSQVEKV